MDNVQALYDELIEKLTADKNDYNLDEIEQAFLFAKEYHGAQTRASGEPYIVHPLHVALITYEFGLDSDSVAAALLHDTIEDTDATLQILTDKFGKSVAELVDGVTKIGQIPYSSKEEAQIEYLRKMFFAMAKDMRVIIIKLADRLHNIRTLGAVAPEKQLRVALETMEIYAPLAHRLGMQKVKTELEDTSLSYLDPVGYKMIVNRLSSFADASGAFIKETLQKISEKIEEYHIKFSIEHRVKHIFSIYRKLFTQNKSFEEIYDVYAFRVIVDSTNDCYFVLGLIHDLFKPIPGRFKDYISTPKQNMYQSLHTTVIGSNGIPFEVQIRTWEMHNTAEYGVAAHWKYKSGIKGGSAAVDNKLHWIRNLMEAHEEVGDTEDFISGLKVDLFSEDVFVFTPKGDVIDLPLGANLIDFAYSIHSEVGNHMIGARVNGKIVPYDYKLKTGEIVEIQTSASKNAAPSRNWITIAKTSEARNKIRQYFKKECREENIQTGMADLEKEIRELGLHLEAEDKQNILETICARMHFTQIDDLYSAIGYGGTSAFKVANKIKDIALKMQKKDIRIIPVHKTKASAGGVVVEGIDNCLIKFAKCCTPLPGDYICGFITKGFGVSIHKIDCPNAKAGMEKQPDRWLKAHWEVTDNASFTATIELTSNEKIGLMASVASLLADMKVSIHALTARPSHSDPSIVLIRLNIEVRDVEHLNAIVTRLRNLKDVLEVKRL